MTELDETCRSGAAVHQTGHTPRTQTGACDRCDTSWTISVANPQPDRIAAAVATRSIADQVITLAADPSAQAAQDDDSQPAGYFTGECGHRVPPVGTAWYVGPCDDCGPSVT